MLLSHIFILWSRKKLLATLEQLCIETRIVVVTAAGTFPSQTGNFPESAFRKRATT